MFTPDPRMRALLQNHDTIVEIGWRNLLTARRQSGVFLSEKEIFFAGASFLFEAVISALDPDIEPTENDTAVMTKLYQELQAFNAGFNAKVLRGPSR